MKEYDFTGNQVLLIDDNELNRDIAQELLLIAGLRVDIAEGGEEALHKFTYAPKDTYQAILMDIEMPVMDGYAVTQAIRTSLHPQAKNIPILAMTGNIFHEDMEKELSAGMNAHIFKPIDTKQLYQVLQQYLGTEAQHD
ncbi:MAG: response regulator [Lachnospiraceae bacterium]